MTDIGELVVRIKADASQLQRELQKAGGTVKRSAGEMGSSLGAVKDQFRELIPILSVAAVVEFGRRAIESASNIKNMGDRIGFASSTLSAMEIPLKTSGSSLEEFSGGVNRMNNLIGEAAKRNPEAVKAFDGLGLSVRRLQALSPEDQFYAIATALGAIGDQSKQTEAGTNIFGRSFAAMLPMLKEYHGNMQKAVDDQKQFGEALSSETIKRIDEFGSALERSGIKTKNAFLEAFAAILKVTDKVGETLVKPATNAKSGLPGNNSAYLYGPNQPKGYWSDERPRSVNMATFLGKEAYGPPVRDKSAKGSNAGLLPPNEIEQELLKLRQQQALLALPQPERAGQQEVYNLQNLAKEKSLALSQQQIAAARELATANYRAQNPDPVQKYIDTLEQETQAIGMSERALAVKKSVLDAQNEALKTAAAGTKAESALSEENRQKVEALAGAYYDLKKAQEENERVAKQMRDAIADSLADIAVNFNSLKDTATNAIQAIAKEIIKAKITNPLASSFIGTTDRPGMLDGILGSLGSFMGSHADGGTVNAGSAYLVGEDGPEIFRPGNSGGITANNRLGGQSVVVNQVFNMQPGLAETVGAAIRSSAPSIAAMAHASVFQAMRQGGSESRVAGLRG